MGIPRPHSLLPRHLRRSSWAHATNCHFNHSPWWTTRKRWSYGISQVHTLLSIIVRAIFFSTPLYTTTKWDNHFNILNYDTVNKNHINSLSFSIQTLPFLHRHSPVTRSHSWVLAHWQIPAHPKPYRPGWQAIQQTPHKYADDKILLLWIQI